MSHVLFDSNVLVALFDTSDVWHTKAEEMVDAIPEKTSHLTLDVVVIESLSAIARRLEEKKLRKSFPMIVESLVSLLPPSKLTWITPLVPLYYDDVLRMMVEHSGTLNFFDALIALYMARHHHHFLVSFDSDFDILPGIQRMSSLHDIKYYLR